MLNMQMNETQQQAVITPEDKDVIYAVFPTDTGAFLVITEDKHNQESGTLIDNGRTVTLEEMLQRPKVMLLDFSAKKQIESLISILEIAKNSFD